MPINSLQQQAFKNAPEFCNQVEAEVKKQALDFAENPELDEMQRSYLTRAITETGRLMFPATIVADYDWTAKYDSWAEDPASTAGAIQLFVLKWFGLLTSYYPPT